MGKTIQTARRDFMYILNSLYQEVKIKMIYIWKIQRSQQIFLKMLSLNQMTQSIMQISLKKIRQKIVVQFSHVLSMFNYMQLIFLISTVIKFLNGNDNYQLHSKLLNFQILKLAEARHLKLNQRLNTELSLCRSPFILL